MLLSKSQAGGASLRILTPPPRNCLPGLICPHFSFSSTQEEGKGKEAATRQPSSQINQTRLNIRNLFYHMYTCSIYVGMTVRQFSNRKMQKKKLSNSEFPSTHHWLLVKRWIGQCSFLIHRLYLYIQYKRAVQVYKVIFLPPAQY